MLPPFPDWLNNGRIIGRNVDGEALAVGRVENGPTWLGRLNRFTETWCSVRQARQEEIDDYDNQVLAEMFIGGRDTRTTPPPEWRLN